MKEVTLRKIIDDINEYRKAPNKQLLLTSGAITGTGDGAASTVNLGTIVYRSWRVIDVGFVVIAAGASTVAETISFGVQAGDIGPADTDYFGTFSQDVNANKQIAAAEMYQRYDHTYLATPDAPANVGTPTWTKGDPDGLLIWHGKGAIITCTKNNVAGSTATVKGWALVEIGEV